MLIAAAFLVAFLVAGILTPLVRAAAEDRGLLDQPEERKVHRTPVPRLGGVAMLIAFIMALGVVELLELTGVAPPIRKDGHLPAILGGIGILAIAGILDDLRGARALLKLAAQSTAALLAFGLGLSIERIAGPWGVVTLGALALPITMIWIVGVINAINLIDGLDGLASGVALAALGAFGVLAAVGNLTASLLIVACAAGAVLGFVRYNMPPATIIMGDTGATFLGFVLAAVAISLTQAPAEPLMAPWVPIIALGVPLADTAWAVVRRLARGEHPFTADRRHIHHQFLERGATQAGTMFALTAISLALAVLAVALGLAGRGG